MEGILKTALEWALWAMRPDPELFWLWCFAFPATVAGMARGRESIKDTCIKAAGVLIFGSIALAILVGFYGTFIGIGLTLFGKVMGALAFFTNPSWDSFVDLFVGLMKLIPMLFGIWLLRKIPFVEDLVRSVLGYVKTAASYVWTFRLKAQEQAPIPMAIVGGAGIALILTGGLAAHLTDPESIYKVLEVKVEWLFPGIVPGASGVIGLLTFGWSFLRKKTARVLGRPDHEGGWKCTRCRGYNLAVNGQMRQACGKCGAKNPYLPWSCGSCDQQDIAWEEKRCPKCGAQRPTETTVPDPSPDPDSAHQAEMAVEQFEIALDVPTVKCTACGEQTPKGFSCEQCGQPLDASIRRFRAESRSGW